MIAVTNNYAVMTEHWWDLITKSRPPSDFAPWKPYTEFPYAVFNGRFIITVKTLGM